MDTIFVGDCTYSESLQSELIIILFVPYIPYYLQFRHQVNSVAVQNFSFKVLWGKFSSC